MLENVDITCPYCGEAFETTVDCSAGSQVYVEDCPVCCQPIDISTEISFDNQLVGVTATRNDE